jgi:hypothetical protein
MAGLVFFFAFNVAETVDKFLDGKTTMTSRIERRNFMTLPTFTVCPDPPLNPKVEVHLSIFFFEKFEKIR